MPLYRVFRGRIVKRTRRLGAQVLVTVWSQTQASPCDRLMVPLAEYLAEVRTTYRPGQTLCCHSPLTDRLSSLTLPAHQQSQSAAVRYSADARNYNA